jgi:ferrochelatase
MKPIGVLLAQVGTPAAPTPGAVRRYLARFLSDQRVVDYPAWLWQPLLRGVILPLRARRSARLYRRIWTSAGSPLLVESRKQQAALQQALGGGYRVALGMAYDGPSFGAAIDDFAREDIDDIAVLPMFPQYASATTASVYEAVFAAASTTTTRGRRRRRLFVPTLRFVRPYFDHPAYIAALAARVRRAVAEAPPDHVVLSFHGIPERYVTEGDPYPRHCQATVTALVAALGWPPAFYSVSFQSRFGPERWLGPETAATLEGLAKRGITRPLVVAPGFTTDCLETLDELGHEGRAQFVAGGGAADAFQLCPCLNDHPAWIDAMVRLVTDEPARDSPLRLATAGAVRSTNP